MAEWPGVPRLGQLVLALGLTTVHAADVVDRPAVVTNASELTRTELRRTVRRALHDAPVILADDALVTSSTLLIERVQRRDPSGLLANGRETGRPERFDLVKHGVRCVLLQPSTGLRWTLQEARCRAVSPAVQP